MAFDFRTRGAHALALAAAMASVAAPVTVHAQPPAQELDPAIIEEASIAYQEGAEEYELGHYDKAIDRFEDAFRLTRNPALHYNLGQAYWKRYDVEPDLAYLRRSRLMFSKYLEYLHAQEPDSKDIREVESYVEKLTTQIEAAENPDEEAPTVQIPVAEGPEKDGDGRTNPPPPPPDEHPKRLGPVGLAGAGVALAGLVGGGVTAGVGVVSAQRLSKQKADEEDHPDWTEAREDEFNTNIGKAELLIYVGAGAGGALLITGVVMVLLDAKKQQAKNEGRASVRPMVGPGSVGVRF